MKKSSKQTMIQIMGNPKYKGKHIIVIKNQVYTARTGESANKLLDRLEQKFPNDTPAITYIPKADTLILWL